MNTLFLCFAVLIRSTSKLCVLMMGAEDQKVDRDEKSRRDGCTAEKSASNGERSQGSNTNSSRLGSSYGMVRTDFFAPQKPR